MFRRGFKTWCEQTAASLRVKKGMPPYAALHARILAEELAVEIMTPDDLHRLRPDDIGADCVHRLLNDHSASWSAITIPNKEKPLVIFNPAHSAARQNSDLMHELAHILLAHEPGMTFIDPQSEMALRTHDNLQEQEAAWLSGCLLLPRDALLRMKRMNWTDERVCREYLVSSEMLRYRLNTSGVNIQHRRAKAF